MIIDAHTHCYDPSRPQGVPWPNPNDKFLYRTVLPQHYREVAEPEGVTGTVVIEASKWVEDNAWLLELAESDSFIKGVVGNLVPGVDGFRASLDRFAANPLFRGIRVGGKVVEDAASAAVVSDVERLVANDLELDLLVRPEHLPTIASLATLLPELRVVINHIAGVFIDGNAPDPAWVEGMQRAAEHPRVYCKASALTSMTRQLPAPTDLEFYAPTLDALWDAFGEDRLIYGSDWPVGARAADYPAVQRIVAQYFGAKGDEAKDKYFCRNSKAAYKWIDR